MKTTRYILAHYWPLLGLYALLTLAGCGTVWTVGFFGATLSVKFPDTPAATMYINAETNPATLPKPVDPKP